MISIADYIQGIKNGDITILSKAITLIESTNDEHQKLAQEILSKCLKNKKETFRIGITGVPGAGKSTFIEALGLYLVKEKDKKIAVLAIDPSSTRSKGSILGDKTRMSVLSTMKGVYIRPSASSGALGGVAKATRETIILCEAAGFDTIIIETVGVGQSETEVKEMVDFFLLLSISGAGDELQGIKRGIMEMADAVVINKADGYNIENADRTAAEYKNALQLFPETVSKWEPKVLTCSSVEAKNITEIWKIIEDYFNLTISNGFYNNNRNEQSIRSFHKFLEKRVNHFYFGNPRIKELIFQYEIMIKNNTESPYTASEKVFHKIIKENKQ